MPITKNGKRLSELHKRPDPRLGTRINTREKDFKGDKSVDATPGRVALAKILYLTRTEVFQLSLRKFGELVSEDRRRELLLAGSTVAHVDQIADLSPYTLMRIEDVIGSKGADNYSLSLVAGRLVNPLTKDFFTPLDLQALTQDYLEIPMKKIEAPGFLTLIRNLNHEKDKELGYIID